MQAPAQPVCKLRGLRLALAAVLLHAATLCASEPPRFNVFLEEPGVYRVTYADLGEALGDERPATESLGVRTAGEPVPIWVVDGGDGTFDPGDSLEFVGRHIAGDKAFLNEYTRSNVYVVDFDDPAPTRMRRLEQRPIPPDERVVGGWFGWRHLERDRLLLRFIPRPDRDPELWYWIKLSHLDPKPFSLELPGGLDLDSGRPIALELHFQGLSLPRYKQDDAPPDHRVEVLVNDHLVGAAEWDGEEEFTLEIPDISGAPLERSGNRLALKVPRRVVGEDPDADPLVDVVVLNYIEVDYPRYAVLAERSAELLWRTDEPTAPLRITAPTGSPLVVYTADGGRLEAAEMPVQRPGKDDRTTRLFTLPGAGPESRLIAVPGDDLRRPDAIEVDQPSNLVDRANQADYLMIVHPRLEEAVKPLAELHRRRGLTVEVIDIRDVYDEFNHGILHPRAIRDLVSHAYHEWRKPAPRYVLLVGDASWDTKNETVRKENYAAWSWAPMHGARIARNQSIPYSENADRNDRNLVPSWSVDSLQGHAASDNWFVAVDGDDNLPDLAIGRLPVIEPEEVTGIVDKTIRYVEHPEVGPWRRNILWITDEQRSFQYVSDQVSSELAGRGYNGLKVYPNPSEVANEQHQQTLHKALADGQLVVHFFGHGGRFIWRTGTPDFAANKDLFTLDDLDALPASGKLPVVLSMTCYSGPFDHPNADSIGEKFLRVADRGAVAVLAASWRNGPTLEFSRALLEELLSTESIGTAIQHAKHQIDSPDLVELYNLLGDPAIPLALPRLSVGLRLADEAGDELRIVGSVGADSFSGRAFVEWLAADGSLLESRELAIDSPSFETAFARSKLPEDAATAFRAYVWSESEGLDGIGHLRLEGPEEPPAEGSP